MTGKMAKRLMINDFVEEELALLRARCNFDEEELQYFNLRAKNKSNVQIALEMNCSEPKVSKLARRVREKIRKVL